MKQFLITIAGVLVGLFLFLILAPIAIFGMIASSADTGPIMPRNAVLALDLRQELADQPDRGPFSFGGLSTLGLIEKIDAAAEDERVAGMFVRANVWGMSAAHGEELRAAMGRFREAGKFIVSHIQMDTAVTSMAGYSVVAGSDELWMAASDPFMPMGLRAESTFFGGAIEKFGLTAEVERREDYKSAGEGFTRRDYSPEARSDIEKLFSGISEQMFAAIATGRELTPDQVRELVAASPFSAEQAKTAKLVDQLGFPHDAEKAALTRAGEEAELFDIEEYEPTPQVTGPVIAVIGGDGGIVSGPQSDDLFSGPALFNSDEIAAAILEASKDEDVKAIVFRVNSPGGTVVAADQILGALKDAKAAGKKVVVSMGPVAASGGYWVSAAADEIVASPSTITGSIGILITKLSSGAALERYTGATTDSIATGSPIVGWASPTRPWTNAEREFVSTYIDQGYDDFLTVVSEGRNLPKDQVRAIAGGRVYTGAQAKEIGLVDTLGGFDVAVARARALAEIGEDEDVQLKYYPEPGNPFEELQRAFGVSAQAARGAVALGAVLGDDRVEAALRQVMAQERAGVARAETGPVEVR